jgi:hypothetical protein
MLGLDFTFQTSFIGYMKNAVEFAIVKSFIEAMKNVRLVFSMVTSFIRFMKNVSGGFYVLTSFIEAMNNVSCSFFYRKVVHRTYKQR